MNSGLIRVKYLISAVGSLEPPHGEKISFVHRYSKGISAFTGTVHSFAKKILVTDLDSSEK